jgi:septum formation protein
MTDSTLILASASAARTGLLRDAGIAFAVEPADIDEGGIKTAQRLAGTDATECAAALALAKARVVSLRHPAAHVIGADQILTVDDAWFDKPADMAAARAQLVALRGRGHRLATAVCVCRNGEPEWCAASEPELAMRQFSDGFLDSYLAAEGEALLGSVGAYRIEARGIQLFAAIEGEHAAILGLPLLDLLEFLRGCGTIVT